MTRPPPNYLKIGKEIHYYKYDLLRNEFVGGSTGITSKYKKILNRMPIPVLKVAGQLLYRHMG